MILCFDALQPKQYIKITIYMTIRRLYYLLTGAYVRDFPMRFFFMRLQICFVVSFYKNNIFYQYWGLIRLMRAYFGKLPSIFSLSRYKFHNFIPWVVECTFSCKYNFVYFSSSDIFFESESVYMSCLMYSKNKLESHP